MRFVFLAVVALVGSGCESCDGCTSLVKVATLTSFRGQVGKQVASASWNPAEVGDDFNVGDAIRTGAKSRALIQFNSGGALHVVERSIIRFARHGKVGRDFRVRVETGSAEIEGGSEPYWLDTEIGVARLERGGKAILTREGDILNLRVLVGTALIEPAGKAPVTVRQGQDLRIEIGAANLEVVPTPKEMPVTPKDTKSTPSAAETAVMLNVYGEGVRVRNPAEPGWRPLNEGTSQAQEGTRLKVGKGSRVEVVRGQERATLAGNSEAEVLSQSQGALLRTSYGTLEVKVGSKDVHVEVPGGVIVAKAGHNTEAELDVDKQKGAQVSVVRGMVDILGKDQHSLRQGESALLNTQGRVKSLIELPLRSHVTIQAGESPTIHDVAKTSTAVRVNFRGQCEGQGVVEMPASAEGFKGLLIRAEGQGGAIVPVRPGITAYRVRCLDAEGAPGEVKASGSFRVKKDTGKTPLPKLPPRNMLDADGRTYTVLYQNLLPELSFRWNPAPSACTAYRWKLRSSKTDRVLDVPNPKLAAKSGEIGEGNYTWWFECLKPTAVKSPVTSLRVEFDNAADAASIRSISGTLKHGQETPVAGAVLEGWNVSVGGQPLKLDKHRRFSTTVRLPTQEDAFAIRISHPSRGVHYYVRRIESAKK